MICNYGLQVFIPISLQVNRVIYLTQVITDGALVPTYPLKNLAFLLSTKGTAVNCYKLHCAGLSVTVCVCQFVWTLWVIFSNSALFQREEKPLYNMNVSIRCSSIEILDRSSDYANISPHWWQMFRNDKRGGFLHLWRIFRGLKIFMKTTNCTNSTLFNMYDDHVKKN